MSTHGPCGRGPYNECRDEYGKVARLRSSCRSFDYGGVMIHCTSQVLGQVWTYETCSRAQKLI